MIARKRVVKFKKGEMVRVLRKAKDFENGWYNTWIRRGMDKSVGLVLLVLNDHGKFGVQLVDGDSNFDYPRHVLVKVKNGRKKK